jgi:NAD(P)-dependent dehydrogenase (short-subunit alcohol dehydrogenase family)
MTTRDLPLAGRVTLITGAGRGIGRGIATVLAQKGAAVVIAELDTATGGQTAQELLAAGHSALFVQTDVTREDSIQAAISRTLEVFDRLDILVNNVGRNLHYDATAMTSEEWDQATAIILKSAWLCSKHALPHMVAGGGGVIVNIASVHASMSMTGHFPYATLKSGLVGLARNLALDWGAKNIRVVAVSPGYVRTPPLLDAFKQAADPAAEEQRIIDLHPIKRIGQPEDVGHLVAFLVSDEAAYITGTEIIIDGGISARYAD